MNTPTPADAHVPPRRRVVFDRVPCDDPAKASVAQRRGRALGEAIRRADAMSRALAALAGSEEDLDLNLERYERAGDRLVHALRELDDALSAGPVLPAPEQRRTRVYRTP